MHLSKAFNEIDGTIILFHQFHWIIS